MFAIRRLPLRLPSCRADAPGSVRLLSTSLPRLSADAGLWPPAPASGTATVSDKPMPSFFTPAVGDTKPFMITTPIFYVNACKSIHVMNYEQ
jgi:hypothetical protein